MNRITSVEQYQAARAAALAIYQAELRDIDADYKAFRDGPKNARRAYALAIKQETYERRRDKLKAKEAEMLSCVNFLKHQAKAGYEYDKQIATYSTTLAEIRAKLARLVNPQNFSEKPLDQSTEAVDTNIAEQ